MRETVVNLASQPIRNDCLNPSLAVSAAGWGGARVLAPDSRSGFVAQWTRGVATNPFINAPGIHHVARPGETWTVLARIRQVSGPLAKIRLNIVPRRSDNLGLGDVWTDTDVPALNTWITMRTTIVAPTDMATMIPQPGRVVGSYPGEDQVFEIDSLMWTRGTYAGQYSDGGTPGWHWIGSPGQSESVGYPYTLESIAGRPPAQVTSILEVPSSFVQEAGSPRSFAVVYNVADPVVGDAWSSTASLRDPAGAEVFLVTRQNLSADGWVRVNSSGDFHPTFLIPNGYTPGKHVVVVSVDGGFTSFKIWHNGTDYTAPKFLTGRFTAATADLINLNRTGRTVPFAAAYAFQMNPTTMQQVGSYLYSRY